MRWVNETMRKKKSNYSLSNKYWLLFLTLGCIALMLLSAYSDNVRGPFRIFANATVIPMQAGINTLGTFLIDITENFETMEMLREENENLREQIATLQEENSRLVVDGLELERLRNMFRLHQEYAEHEKIGARVISADGNWFHNLTLNRGSIHGVRPNMNVIAEGGLVGIVTEVGPTWSNVRTIIDDTSNVSGMILHTLDRCIVRGDLSLMNERRMRFEGLENNDNPVDVGDVIVTSYISRYFLQGLRIGYIVEINVDASNLTRFGYIVPAVDFQNIQEVLIIMQTKEDFTRQTQEGLGGNGAINDGSLEQEPRENGNGNHQTTNGNGNGETTNGNGTGNGETTNGNGQSTNGNGLNNGNGEESGGSP